MEIDKVLLMGKAPTKHIYQRALRLPFTKASRQEIAILSGAPKVGKTSYALGLLGQVRDAVYLDLSDSRLGLEMHFLKQQNRKKGAHLAKADFKVDSSQTPLIIEELNATLLKLYLEKRLGLLILDGFVAGHLGLNILLPNVKVLLVCKEAKALEATNKIGQKQPSLSHGLNEGLSISKSITLLPPSFEEYISFPHRREIGTLFDSFLRLGASYVEVSDENAFIRGAQDDLRLALYRLTPSNSPLNYTLFCIILEHIGGYFSAYTLYTLAKERGFGVSKDKVYALYGALLSSSILYELKTARGACIFAYNFALPYICIGRFDMGSIIRNMMLLELLHLGLAPRMVDGALIANALVIVPYMFVINFEESYKRLAKSIGDIKECEVVFVGLSEASEQKRGYKIMSFIEFMLEFRHGIARRGC